MLRALVLTTAFAVALCGACWAQESGEALSQMYREPRLQLGTGLEWRFDNSAEPIAFFPRVKAYVWPMKFLALHTGVSFRYQGEIYGMASYSVFGLENGVRLQVPNVRLAGFIELVIDTRWYHGKSGFVADQPVDTTAATGSGHWLWQSERRTGLSAVLGLTHHLNRRAALDFSIRKVWNKMEHVRMTSIPDPDGNGFYFAGFADGAYNPATFEVHFRYGL
jgi:hypothetical protein